MNLIETDFKDLFVCEPTVFEDARGYFFEAFNERLFKQKTGLKVNFIQDNQSCSRYGVLRGLHLQTGEYSQAKLVRVLKGEVLDVAVDLRRDEPTFGKHYSIILSAENKKQLFIPRGFAHGFVVLSEEAEFFYKCDNFYNSESEVGILYDDSELDIDWMLSGKQIIISAKDQKNYKFSEFHKRYLL
jgi:dTDP-4-dehydrorhamnose 3,5-epimerase